jgi:hypothetical protein
MGLSNGRRVSQGVFIYMWMIQSVKHDARESTVEWRAPVVRWGGPEKWPT